ncbi:M36 family metallopeptidase [Hymenobacter sp. J193]|uniref:M36 family metallopeptidase n=1 Tax=Hymenobacter sp. J193 TaxID=2898429 RepID=UPI0021512454|nr:M36 family metallopeptidase [Hymenobacter sp. J193]MCR5888313.1 M36 family metallopeptidase [Hymenobacter sp. J193]
MKTLFTSLCAATLLGLATPVALYAQAPAAKAQQYLTAHYTQLGLQPADVQDPAVTDAYTDEATGLTHVYLRQQHQGLPVLGTEMGLHFDVQGNLLTRTGRFVADLAHKAPTATASLSGIEATLAAAQNLHLTPATLKAVSTAQSRSARLTLRDEALSKEAIPVALMYSLGDDNQVHLLWEVTLHPPRSKQQWHMLVDATTGRVVQQHDRNKHEKLLPPAPSAIDQLATPQPTRSNRPSADNASYTVFAIPTEGPSFGGRTTVRNPADVQASPYGWHDTNGTAGAEFTTTRGNNVQAYVLDANSRPAYFSGGTSLAFNPAYDMQKSLADNRDAAVVNLFYMNNIMHDVFYHYGFREESGNFQVKNYTGKGRSNDAIRAVAQDPEDVYNAYFVPSVDGTSPQMHMFMWPAPNPTTMKVTSPASIADTYPAATSAIGPALPPTTPLTGKVVLVNDGSSTPTLACSGMLTNASAVKGNIALLDRGDCEFIEKVRTAQNAGAIAVIVINNVPDELITMSGDEQFDVPSLNITLAAGELLKARLKAGETVTVELLSPPKKYVDRDGSFDNAIVSHEYTHGITTRLTGGPSTAGCLENDENMGEGWSDFVALWLTTRPGDKATTPRSVGTYAVGEATDGEGIRLKLYTTDITVNDYTYAIIGKPYTETHDIGEVWATVLWDLNWAMIERYGYDADVYRGTGGNNKAMQLVMEALKLQPCSPGFLDGRDAILAADKALYKSANEDLIWRVFARRGMGTDAVQGSSKSVKDNKAGFAVPAALATKATLSAASVEVYPNPANDVLTVRTFGLSAAPVQVEVLSVVGSLLRTVSVSAAQAQVGTTLDLSQLANGVYMVRVTTPQGTLTKKVMVRH